MARCRVRFPFMLTRFTVALMAMTAFNAGSWASDFAGVAHAAGPAKKTSRAKASPAITAAQRYLDAIAGGDRVTAGQLDFACQYRLVTADTSKLTAFPPETSPVYGECWDQIEQIHAAAIEQTDRGMDTVWPGKNALVFFTEDLSHYVPSFFTMSRLGTTPPGSGLRSEVLSSSAIPAASFKLREHGPTVAAPATKVRVRISYKDPITSPITYASGAYQWTNTVKRPKQALKAVTVDWVVLAGLKKLGFPGDTAVLNVPVAKAGEPGGPIPFVVESGGYVPKSAAWWEPADVPGLLIASVGRASHFPDLRERIAMLNRVLLIDPLQADALTLLTRDLYDTLLNASATLHHIPVGDPTLAARFNEIYWDTYAQTTRMDISLGMEMGGLNSPTPADYLYRLLPAMEKLAKIRPEDLENRLRLGIVYRWNNDQLAAIHTHEALVNDIPPQRADVRARALIELAWSRIARVSWNRTFDDPGIHQAYTEAEEAFKLTDRPVDKFAAVYTMAYSLLFTPNRDNQAVLERLTKAKDWYLQLPGATPDSWRYLLANDNLKGLVEADPSFQPLLAVS
ncbi:MAG TPA: hypothetical protein VJ692_12665 [Nitrospiraceae bacterium]|nr:hypothetical protein [Nitrospiraceae bacterium]